MGCCASSANVPPYQGPESTRMNLVAHTVLASTSSPSILETSSAAPLFRSRGKTRSVDQPKCDNERTSPRRRVVSAPRTVHSLTLSSSQDPRSDAQLVVGPGRSGVGPSNRARTNVGTQSLTSTMLRMLSNHSKFRILVVGIRGSGKSSLINAIFKVDTSAMPEHISQEISPDDNHYLIFHEYAGFEPGDGKHLQAIRDFISDRTDPALPPPERLHVVWICVPAPDAMSGNIGEGVEEILNIRRVPVIVAFTKFDQVVALEDGSSARTRVEQFCRTLFHRELKEVPAEIVSVRPQFSDLVDNLVTTTDKLITASRTLSIPSGQSSAQETMAQIAPVPLVWSAALRVNHHIVIRASIEVGQSRYWRALWSSRDFADRPLKECVDVIHTDIVEVWNLNDKSRCLSGAEFKAKMSHVVKDLAEPVGGMAASSDFAEWVYDVYRSTGSCQGHVRCVMGYIVDLTVILDDILRTAAGRVSVNDIQTAVDRHVSFGRRDYIHRDISSFVKETFTLRFAVMPKDLVLEKIIDLIRQYCVPPSTGGYG